MLSGVLFRPFIMKRLKKKHFKTSCITCIILVQNILVLIPSNHERAKTGLRPRFYLNCSHMVLWRKKLWSDVTSTKHISARGSGDWGIRVVVVSVISQPFLCGILRNSHVLNLDTCPKLSVKGHQNRTSLWLFFQAPKTTPYTHDYWHCYTTLV